MKANEVPDCFGNQARAALCGDPPTDCVACEVFDKCHKYTVAASLQCISDGLDLIVQNGLADGRLKGFQELEALGEAELGKKPSE